MSITKRKAGSEDIEKSILEFDEVPTEGSPNLVESGAVAKAIGNLGQPLQWKGPATVAQLNAGITGIQPGWTYTLTDAGTLTDGSVAVDVGDEVAWTGTAWFKVGGDSGKLAVFDCSDNGNDQNFFTGPTYAQLETARTAGKTIVLLVHYGFDTVVDRYFVMTNYSFGRDAFSYKFTSEEGRVMQFSGTVGDVEHHAWSKASAYDSSLSSTSTNAVQNSTLYAVIGDVETLLAAL